MRFSPVKLTRRSFLATAAVAPFGCSRPAPGPEQPPVGPAEKVTVGFIGVGKMGRAHVAALMERPDVQAVAVCDVVRERTESARQWVETHYADQTKSGTYKGVKAYSDFRELLQHPGLDVVVIATPDHWHANAAVLAARAGKHVYCEKPLTLTVAEGRALVRAARRHNVVVQTGSQQRSDARFRQACELVRNGKLGRIHTIRVGLPAVNFAGPAVADSTPPAQLDYDFWLGPAPQRPYNEKRVHYNFRFFWDYSGGQMTNFGAHDLDIVQWALGMDESGPLSVEGTAQFHPERWYEVPRTSELTYTYPGGVRVLVGQGNGTPGGARFEGSDGWIHVNRRAITGEPASLLRTEFGERDVRLAVSSNHHQNWLESIRAGRRPICDVEVGHRSATVCHLGSIALRTGRPLRWDASSETVQGDEEQQRMLQRPYRDPWRLPVSG
jgi:predicted dehydrogenase